MSYDEALRQIERGRAHSFDPDVVDAFLAIPFRDLAAIAGANGLELTRGESRRRAPATSPPAG